VLQEHVGVGVNVRPSKLPDTCVVLKIMVSKTSVKHLLSMLYAQVKVLFQCQFYSTLTDFKGYTT